jgi:hypothetical protein
MVGSTAAESYVLGMVRDSLAKRGLCSAVRLPRHYRATERGSAMDSSRFAQRLRSKPTRRDGEMKAYDVLFEHHEALRGHCKKISEIPAESDERREALDELLVELDIHMRIEDDLFYPAVSAASSLVAIAHAEHRQVWDQLAVVLRTPARRRSTTTSGARSSPFWMPTPVKRSATCALLPST